MHLAADRTRHPAGMPAGLGGVDGGNQWHVEVFGESDGGVGNQPVVGVHDIRPPRSPVRTADLQRQSRADHRMSHGQCPGHHVGAEVELVRVLCGGHHPHALGDLVCRRVRTGIGARGAAAEHHDVVAVGGQCRRELINVAAEPADHHRRVLPGHHQDLHERALVARERPQNASVPRRVDVQTRTLAGSGGRVTLAAVLRPGRRTGRRHGSSHRPTAGRARDGPTPAHRRSRGWRARAGARDNARSRRRSPC